MTRPRNSLKMADSFRLMELVKATYAARGATDVDFAAEASITLGLSVNANNVATAREAFGIPSTRQQAIDAGKPNKPNPEELALLRSCVTQISKNFTAQDLFNGQVVDRFNLLLAQQEKAAQRIAALEKRLKMEHTNGAAKVPSLVAAMIERATEGLPQ